MKTVTGNNKYSNPWSTEEDFTLMFCLLKAKNRTNAFKLAELMIKRTPSAIKNQVYSSKFLEKYRAILGHPSFPELLKNLKSSNYGNN